MTEFERVDPRTSATILALLQPYPTVRSVGKAAGDKSPNTTHQRLWALRRAGWCAFEDGRQGTLRPTFTVHAPQHKTATTKATEMGTA